MKFAKRSKMVSLKLFDARHPEITRGSIGRAQGEAQFMKEIGILMLIAIGVAYFLIAVAFRSYAEPLAHFTRRHTVLFYRRNDRASPLGRSIISYVLSRH